MKNKEASLKTFQFSLIESNTLEPLNRKLNYAVPSQCSEKIDKHSGKISSRNAIENIIGSFIEYIIYAFVLRPTIGYYRHQAIGVEFSFSFCFGIEIMELLLKC